MANPIILTVAAAIRRFAAGTLPPSVEIDGTAGNIARHLDALEAIAEAGDLALVHITGASILLPVKASQVANDAQFLSKIAGPYQLSVRDTAAHVTASLSALETAAKAGHLANIALPSSGTQTLTLTAAQASGAADALIKIVAMDHVVVSDSAAQVAANLDGLQTIAGARRLTSIQLTGGSTTLTLKAAQVGADAQALARIAGGYHLTVNDTAVDVAASLDVLEAAVKAGTLTSVVLTDVGAPVLTITAAQLRADADVLALLPANYLLNVTGVSAGTATSVARMAHVASVSVTDTAANVLAHLSQLEKLVGSAPGLGFVAGGAGFRADVSGQGVLDGVTLSDPGVPLLTLSDSQLSSDGGVLGLITSPFTLSVTGVLAADAASLAANPLVQSLSVSDTAASVAANLSGLEAANTAGKIAFVSVSGALVSSDIGDSAMLLYTKVIDVSEITLNINGYDNIRSGLFGGYIQNGPAAADIQVPVNLSFVSGGTYNTSDILNVQNAINNGYISSVSGSDGIHFFAFSTGDLPSITNQIVSDAFLTQGDFLEYSIGNLSVAQALDYYLSPASTAVENSNAAVFYKGAGAPVHVSDAAMIGAISDTAADLQGGLDAFAAALAGRSLTVPIRLTDTLPPTISVSATQAVNDASVLNAVTSGFLLSIQGSAAELSALNLSALTNEKIELTFTSLDQDVTVNGAGVYDVNLAQLLVTGGATFTAWSSAGQSGTEIDLTGTDGLAHKIILIGTDPAAFNLYGPLDNGMTLGVSQLTGVLAANAYADGAYTDVTSITLADSAANITANLSQLEDVFKAGKLSGITLTDPGVPVLTLSDSQLSSDGGVLGLITSPFTLSVTGVLAADAASLAANPLVQSLSVSDTAASVAANLSGLEAANTAGKIAFVSVSGALVSSDIGDSAMLLYTKVIDVSEITLNINGYDNIRSGLFGGYIQNGPAAADIQVPVNLSFVSGGTYNTSDILNVQNAINNGYISSVSGSDGIHFFAFSTGDLPSITNQIVSDAFLTQGDFLEYSIGNLSVAQALDYYLSPASTAVENSNAAVFYKGAGAPVHVSDAAMIGAISDTAADLQGGLDAFAAALAGRSLTVPIRLTDTLPPTISVSATQAVNDASVLNAVTSGFLLSIQGSAAELSALNLSALTNEKIELTFTSLDQDVTVNGAGVYDVNLAQLLVTGGATFTAWSSAGQSGTEIDLTGTDGLAHKIILIGTDPAAFNLYGPLDNGMTLGVSQLTGVLAANAYADGAYTDVTSITLADSAANITANLSQLEDVFKAGKLAGVTITSGSLGTLTASQLFNDADIIRLINAGSSSSEAMVTPPVQNPVHGQPLLTAPTLAGSNADLGQSITPDMAAAISSRFSFVAALSSFGAEFAAQSGPGIAGSHSAVDSGSLARLTRPA